MNKQELFNIIGNWPLEQEDIDRFPPEIDELSILLARETSQKISQGLAIQLTLEQWGRLQAIIQQQLGYTIPLSHFPPVFYEIGIFLI